MTTRPRVLVIDDEAALRKLIARALGADHDVETVGSAEEALELTRAQAFDVILCDLMMPTMSGMEFHAEIRKTGAFDERRIIFLTGGAYSAAARAFLAGVPNPKVEKPFDPVSLRTLVSGHALKFATPAEDQ